MSLLSLYTTTIFSQVIIVCSNRRHDGAKWRSRVIITWLNIFVIFYRCTFHHFLFNGSFYDQIDGVAMGSPLAPVLANLFMGNHEKLWLEKFQGSEMLFYRRYLVDDTFCLFHSEHDAIMFFDYINSRHPNIRFTMEKDHFSVVTQKKIRHFIKDYCNDLDIKVVFSSFKIGNLRII